MKNNPSINANIEKNTHIKNLYLDPNNYRFIENENYIKVPDDKIFSKEIQERTSLFLCGRKRENIKDLIESFKKNGYLPVDQIQVKKMDTNKYLIVEGNRRVTALKELYKDYKEKLDIGNLNPSVFRSIPIVFYENTDETHHFILMGLKHINGNKKWPAINQAILLHDLINDYKMAGDDVIKSLGISLVKLRKSLRAIAFINDYKKSDFGDQFTPDMYANFEETLNLPTIREWLDWDDNKYIAKDRTNVARMFSWFSEDEEVSDEANNPENEDDSNQIAPKKLEKIIKTRADIRDLAKFINDKKAVDAMETSRSISQAYLLSDRIVKDKFENALNIIDDQINTAMQFSPFAAHESKSKLNNILNKVQGLIVSKGFMELVTNRHAYRETYINYLNDGFSKIDIINYKALKNIKIQNIRKINIIAGINNSGKSSFLEAAFLLTKLNDLNAFFDIQKKRGKFSELNTTWINEQFKENIQIEGCFDHKYSSVQILNDFEEDEEIDKTYYLSTISTSAKFVNENLQCQARLYRNKPFEIFYKNAKVICNSTFSSPFSLQFTDDVKIYHKLSVETKSIDRIISFLKEKVDNDIENIELAGELNRFYVRHKKFPEAKDITQFGEGLQRVFFVALHFSAARNGVIFIDELENAIHFELLIDFANLIVELADEFNVQVFFTSHSKECIDSFFSNNIDPTRIAVSVLVRSETGNITCKSVPGEKYSKLISTIDADIRSAK